MSTLGYARNEESTPLNPAEMDMEAVEEMAHS